MPMEAGTTNGTGHLRRNVEEQPQQMSQQAGMGRAHRIQTISLSSSVLPLYELFRGYVILLRKYYGTRRGTCQQSQSPRTPCSMETTLISCASTFSMRALI